MIASISVAIQFLIIGSMQINYALSFGVLTVFAVFVGLKGIATIVKRTGK